MTSTGDRPAARANAAAAGVDHLIHFQQRPVSQLSHPKKYGFLITNPPYGERIEDKKNLPELYKTIGERFAAGFGPPISSQPMRIRSGISAGRRIRTERSIMV